MDRSMELFLAFLELFLELWDFVLYCTQLVDTEAAFLLEEAKATLLHG